MLKFITGNKTKVKEASAVLAPLELEQVDIDLAEIQELDPHVILKHKLQEAFKELSPTLPLEKGGSGPTHLFSPPPLKSLGADPPLVDKEGQGEFIVEDSSMYMDALGGKLPGPLIKWFLESIGIQGLADIADKFGNHKARAKTVIGYAKSPDDILFFEGNVEGIIVQPRGDYNFGYDKIFVPEGHSMTLGELKAQGNFNVSPRGLAMAKLKDYILKNKVSKQ